MELGIREGECGKFALFLAAMKGDERGESEARKSCSVVFVADRKK